MSSLMRNAGLFIAAIVMTTVPSPLAIAEDEPAIDFSKPRFAKLSEKERKLLSEYLQHYDRLRSYYTNVRIKANHEVYLRPQTQSPPFVAAEGEMTLRQKRSYSYFAREGRHFRLEISQEVPEEDGQRFVIGIVTPTEGYLLGKDSKTSAPFLMAHGKDVQDHLYEMESYWFHIAPYSIDAVNLRDHLLRHEPKNFVIDSIQEDGSLVTIMTNCGDEENWQRTTIVLDKSASWAVQRVETRARTPSYEPGETARIVQTCEYEGQASDGIPLLRKAFTEAFRDSAENSSSQLVRREVFDILEISEEPTALAEFDAPSILGDQIGEAKPPSFSYLAFSIGNVLVVVGLFYLLTKRTKRDPTSN